MRAYAMERYLYTCEVCDKTAVMTPDEAFKAGWDYPPFMGEYGVISPRTRPDCAMLDTVWAALTMKKIPFEQLTDRQKAVVERIMNEPASMTAGE